MPALPVWLIVVIACALLALLAHGSYVLARKRLPRRWIITLGILRVVIVLVFALCLLQPVVSLHRTEELGPPVFVLLDTSKSMAPAGSESKAGRLADAVQWLDASGLRNSLSARPDTYWFAFDAHARSVVSGDVPVLQANGTSTRYAESLSDAWEHCRQQPAGHSIVPGGRVLLASDGNDTDPQDVVAVARRLGLSIDTLAPPTTPADKAAASIRIVQVQAPRRVLLGAESRFAAILRQEGLAGKSLQLQLKEGDKVVASQPLTFEESQPEKTVSVSFRPEEVGLKEYTLAIDGLAGTHADTAEAPHFSVQVAGGRNEVLFLEDSWRWEFKFLRRIFEDDPNFTLTAFLSRGENSFVQFAEPDRRTQVNGFPQSRAELAGYDTFVLGSAEPRRWPRGFSGALRQLVEEDGKSLIVIAGPNLRQMLEQPGIAELLPVELSRESATPTGGPVTVRITPEGLGTQFFAAPGSAPGSLWAALPAVDQVYPAVRKKPAATALAEAAQLSNSYGHVIVMAEHTVGRGRVLFVGTDTLWKWQTLATTTDGPTPYQVFWQQALRALAPIRQSAGNVNLNLEPDRSHYEAGQPVVLRAEVQSGRPLPGARVQSQVTLPDGKQLPLDFAPSATEPGIYTARFEAAVPGQHKVSATVVADDKVAADTLVAFDVEASAGESAAQPANEANLARIARETGGHVINRADPTTWRDLEDTPKVSVTRVQTVDLWGDYTLLVLLSVLLGADWLLRLLRGFA